MSSDNSFDGESDDAASETQSGNEEESEFKYLKEHNDPTCLELRHNWKKTRERLDPATISSISREARVVLGRSNPLFRHIFFPEVKSSESETGGWENHICIRYDKDFVTMIYYHPGGPPWKR